MPVYLDIARTIGLERLTMDQIAIADQVLADQLRADERFQAELKVNLERVLGGKGEYKSS